MPQLSDKNATWLQTTETVLLAGSIGSSVASVVLQQVTFAAITSVQLSLVLGLNSWNRKRWDDLNQQNQSAIAQIQQQLLKDQSSVHQIEATIRQLPTHQDITTLQQLSESAIAQIQQQLLKANTRQLPTYQDIATLQQQLEQLKTDHQKRLNQLSEARSDREIQFEQAAIEKVEISVNKKLSQLTQEIQEQKVLARHTSQELSVLQQAATLNTSEDIELIQNRIHDLRAYIQTNLEKLEVRVQESSQNWVKSQISSQIEPFLSQLKNLPSEYASFEKRLLENQQTYNNQLQQISNQFVKLSSLQDFNPDDIRHDIQILLEELGKLEDKINSGFSESASQKVSVALEEYITQSHTSLKSDLQKTDIEIDRIFKLIEDLDHKFQEIQKGILERSNKPTTPCEHCGRICNPIFVGGLYDNYNFCSKECRKTWTTNRERNSQSK